MLWNLPYLRESELSCSSSKIIDDPLFTHILVVVTVIDAIFVDFTSVEFSPSKTVANVTPVLILLLLIWLLMYFWKQLFNIFKYILNTSLYHCSYVLDISSSVKDYIVAEFCRLCQKRYCNSAGITVTILFLFQRCYYKNSLQHIFDLIRLFQLILSIRLKESMLAIPNMVNDKQKAASFT